MAASARSVGGTPRHVGAASLRHLVRARVGRTVDLDSGPPEYQPRWRSTVPRHRGLVAAPCDDDAWLDCGGTALTVGSSLPKTVHHLGS